MADSSLTPDSSDDLQFSTAELAQDAGEQTTTTCSACGQPIGATYYALADHVICPACHEKATAPVEGSGFLRFLKASLFGIGAGLVGAAIWFAVRRAANMEIGLVAILVGFMVGKAVYKGSENQGGVGYQFLAVIITYCCIATNYMPDAIEGLLKAWEDHRAAVAADAPGDGPGGAAPAAAREVQEAKPGPVLWVLLFVAAFVVSLALPFLLGFQNLIGLLIIGFALWEAWKFNARRPLPISGPYQMAA